MKTHCMDVLILLLALLGTVTVIYLEYGYSVYDSTEQGSVNCWTPAYFMHNHNVYTNSICELLWKSGDVYDSPSRNPSGGNMPIRKRAQIGDDDDNDNAGDDDRNNIDDDDNLVLKRLLLAQCLVSVFTFALTQMVAGALYVKVVSSDRDPGGEERMSDLPESDVKLGMEDAGVVGERRSRRRGRLEGMSASRGLTVIYYGILLTAAITWFILAAQSQELQTSYHHPLKEAEELNNCENCTTTEDEKHVDIFLCDFSIRQMGNVHRHTVQCVAAPQYVDGGRRLIISVQINTAVCFTIAILLLLQLLYALVVIPLVNRLVGDNTTKKHLVSDANLATMFGLL